MLSFYLFLQQLKLLEWFKIIITFGNIQLIFRASSTLLTLKGPKQFTKKEYTVGSS